MDGLSEEKGRFVNALSEVHISVCTSKQNTPGPSCSEGGCRYPVNKC